MNTQMQGDSEVLQYILTVFPPEIEALDQLARALRRRNANRCINDPADVEPVLVTALWMRRVVREAQQDHVDVKGIFELSASLPKENAPKGFRAADRMLAGMPLKRGAKSGDF